MGSVLTVASFSTVLLLFMVYRILTVYWSANLAAEFAIVGLLYPVCQQAARTPHTPHALCFSVALRPNSDALPLPLAPSRRAQRFH